MTVSLTISETLDGTQIADSLATGGPAQTGMDLGSVQNGSFSPLIDKSANTGKKDLYIRHDAVDDPITGVKFYLEQFSGSYGGADSAANDYTSILTLGNASGSSKNNNDGNSGGVWIDQDWDVSSTNQFDYATNGWSYAAGTPVSEGGNDSVSIFGNNGGTTNGDGDGIANAIELKTMAQVYDAPGETAASAPEAGKIGVNGSTTLGDNAHIKNRIYLPDNQAQGGIFQFDFTVAYSYTS